MRFCFFPSTDKVKERLDARFAMLAVSAGDQITQKAREELDKDLTDPTNAHAAITAMRSAIALLESGSADARVEYLRAAADLQVSKGSGLLAFTAIIAATAGIALDKVLHHPIALWLCLGSALVALVASLMTLFVVWSSAPTSDQFSTAAKESQWLTTLLVGRARKSNLAVVLGVLAMLLLVVAGGVRIFLPVDPPPPTCASAPPTANIASAEQAATPPASAGAKARR